MAQFLDTTVVGGFRTDFGEFHHFFAVDMEGLGEMILVPQLEKPHVQTDMGRVQTAILRKLLEDPVQMSDVVHQ
ncbi:MAG: hypothetical protein AAF620_00695 [Bacteroidota bacterium]